MLGVALRPLGGRHLSVCDQFRSCSTLFTLGLDGDRMTVYPAHVEKALQADLAGRVCLACWGGVAESNPSSPDIGRSPHD